MAPAPCMGTWFKSKLYTILGAVCCVFGIIFMISTIPVFIYRKVVIFLAKTFRSDLGEILNGQSAIFVGDYMASTPPRSNIVSPMTFQGQLTCEELKARVMNKWISPTRNDISGKSGYENFQRYPFRWLGFTFWKDASSTFSVDNHIHKISGLETQVTEETLTEIMEALLNKRLPTRQSPWEMYIIEKYAKSDVDQESGMASEPHSVFIIKWHHCLSDGTGIMEAMVGGLFEQCWMRVPPGPQPHVTTLNKVLRVLTLPAVAFTELSYFLSHTFRSSPFKVPDEKKAWHQVVVRSGPIPIKLIKDIKNRFGVSYTSVILSAISAAIYKTLMDMSEVETRFQEKAMPFLSVLPAIGITKRKMLTNHLTGAVFDLPIANFESPVERLISVNGILENTKMSAIPMLAQWYSTLLGAHPYLISCWFAKNKMIPIGLSNFAASADHIVWDSKRKWICTETIAGATAGDTGVGITAVGHGQYVGIQLCVEKSLLTKEKAQLFLEYLEAEMEALRISVPSISIK